MDNNGWIDAAARPPCKEDADAKGCVEAWHQYNGVMIAGWHQFGLNPFLLYWRPVPPPPPGFEIWEKKK